MEKIDILYIHPSKFMEKPGYSLFPIGIVGLMNLLKDNGYKVRGLNYPVEKGIDKNFNIEKYLSSIDFSVVLIDMFFYEHITSAISIAKICKDINKNAKVICGGLTATYFSKEILQNIKYIDFIIRGEAELPLVELIKNIFSGKYNFSSIPNLCFRDSDNYKENDWEFEASEDEINCLNFVDVDFFEHSSLQFQIDTLHNFHNISLESQPSFVLFLGRGCIYNCSFCGGAVSSQQFFFGKNRFLIRKPERIFQDIKTLNKKGVRHFIVGGDITIGGKNFYGPIFESIRKENLNISMHSMIYQLPSDDFIYQFSKTMDIKTSKIELSPLSGSEEVRKRNGKNFSNKEFLSALKIMKENKIFVEIFFQVYLPYENFQSFKQTLALVEDILSIYPRKMCVIHCMPVLLDPGSPMYREPQKYNITHNMKYFLDYYRYSKLNFPKIWNFNTLGYYPHKEKINLLLFQGMWALNKIRNFR